MYLDDLLPIMGVGLLCLTTIVSLLGVWAMGRARGLREVARVREAELDTRVRLERMEANLQAIGEEIERLGEVQRFALKVISDKIVTEPEPSRLPHGRVITPS